MRVASSLLAAGLLLHVWAVPTGATPPPEGAVLYGRHCARCHGPSGRGDGPDAELFASRPRDLRYGIMARYSTDDLVRRIRSGAPLQLGLDLPALKARATEVEALAAHLHRLPTVDWRRVELGQEVYVDRCEVCHGAAGQPGPTLPHGARAARDLADPSFQRAITDDQLAHVVRHRQHGMPPLEPPVAANEIPALVGFVRLLSPGFALYDRYCAACHGDDGRGAGDFASDLPRPTVVFDADYFRRRDPEQVRTAIWHMLADQRPAMPHLRSTLTEADARAIVQYLKNAK